MLAVRRASQYWRTQDRKRLDDGVFNADVAVCCAQALAATQRFGERKHVTCLFEMRLIEHLAIERGDALAARKSRNDFFCVM